MMNEQQTTTAAAEPLRERFWEKPLASLNRREWEALCDGCGRCCLNKLEDEDSGELYYTNVACRYLDHGDCHCSAYEHRQQLVPDCVALTDPEQVGRLSWMPSTCAYRLRYRGEPLPWWHPLKQQGSRRAMEQAGIAVSGRVISEDAVDEAQLEDHVIRWVSPSC